MFSTEDTDLAVPKNTLVIYFYPNVDFFYRQYSVRGAFPGGEIHFYWGGNLEGLVGIFPTCLLVKKCPGGLAAGQVGAG